MGEEASIWGFFFYLYTICVNNGIICIRLYLIDFDKKDLVIEV